jgi:hypothetical protein
VERAVRAGLLGAVDDAENRGRLGGLEASCEKSFGAPPSSCFSKAAFFRGERTGLERDLVRASYTDRSARLAERDSL